MSRKRFLVDQASAVQWLDIAVRWINLYPVDNAVNFVNSYPLDRNLSVV